MTLITGNFTYENTISEFLPLSISLMMSLLHFCFIITVLSLAVDSECRPTEKKHAHNVFDNG